MKFDLEARAKTLKGTLTVGSREGYSGKEFGLKRVEDALDVANENIYRQGLNPLPCIMSQGKLIGRSDGGSAKYTERVYRLEFELSPRAPSIKRKKFQDVLIAYAESIGKQLKQTRVYVEFDGVTSVLKAKEQKT